MTDPTPAKLRELLLNEFSEDELKALCASIDIDYDKLAGAGTFGKTRALIDTVKSQDRLRNLQAKVRELRPAAYEAAGFNLPSEPDSSASVAASSTVSTPAQARREGSSSSPLWPWIALAAIILLCMAVGVSLLLPRLQGNSQPAPTVAAITAIASPTAGAANAGAATETPPAIVEVTEALDKGAGELTSTVPAADATAAPIETPTALIDSTAAPGGIVITVTATSTPASAISTITPTTVPTDAHPSALVIGDLNEQLPKFYRGEVDVQAIQEYWTGEALRSVVGFGTLRLPRAMRIQPSQRNTLDVSYKYLNGPNLIRETTDGAVVTSREYWRYATSANPTEICETRDYVYNLVRVDGQYKVSEFSSRIVDSGC